MREQQGGAVLAMLALAATGPAVVAAPVEAAQGMHCGGLPATIVGTNGDERIIGTPRRDVIVARGGNDNVFGGPGHDVICMGPGNDVAVGDQGDDVIRGGFGKDVVLGEGGADVLRGGADADFISGGTGADRLVGWTGDDILDDEGALGAHVQAGPGEDEVFVAAVPGTPLSLLGGSGRIDVLSLSIDDSRGGVDVQLDQSTGTFTSDGVEGRYGGWLHTNLWGDHRWNYRGTDEPDELVVNSGRFTGHLFGSDDFVSAHGRGPHYVDGGDGDRDTAQFTDRDGVLCIDVELGDC